MHFSQEPKAKSCDTEEPKTQQAFFSDLVIRGTSLEIWRSQVQMLHFSTHGWISFFSWQFPVERP